MFFQAVCRKREAVAQNMQEECEHWILQLSTFVGSFDALLGYFLHENYGTCIENYYSDETDTYMLAFS